ncbi:MAG: glutamate carboxypeptidase, partial [Actinomycetota bacterium]|nr:glutamate carboxypeptidase [Actinomycetota bacterium]
VGEHLGGHQEPDLPPGSRCDNTGQAGAVQHAHMVEHQDHGTPGRDPVDPLNPDPEEAPDHRHHDGNGHPPPAIELGSVHARMVTGSPFSANQCWTLRCVRCPAPYTSRVDMGVLQQLAADRYEGFVAELREMVDIDSGSFSPAGVIAVADRCESWFRDGGWALERRPHAPEPGEPQLGDLLIGRLAGAGGPSILLVGHMDTVFDDGTVAERPFRIEGDRARGPGVSDMKGGLLTGFAAVEILQAAGFDGFSSITYICNPDEEIGSFFSGPIIREMAPSFDAAYVLEGARANGDVVSARKGITDYTVTVHGRAAHAGVEPEKGANALLQAAHTIIALQELNGRWPGVTVNVGVAHGGTRTNVVPAACELQVDLRAPELSTLEAAEAEITRLCGETEVPGVSITLEASGWHRPMEKKAPAQRLVDIARRTAADLGFELQDAATGGASDANTTSAAGTPTIDGLGPVGGDDHAPAEWLDLTSVVPRIALLAGIIART